MFRFAMITAEPTTRGFISAMKWGSRAAKLGREANPRRDKGIAVAFISLFSAR
jgi:hypothetical protein